MRTAVDRKHRHYLSNECVGLTEKALRIAERALRRCNAEKTDKSGNPRPANLLWVLGLGTKLVTTARSILLLLENGHIDSCDSLRRAFQEALVNIFYILDGTNRRTDDLFDRFILEYRIDVYEDMVRSAKILGMSLSDFVAKNPSKYGGYVEGHEKAKSHPIMTADRRLQQIRSEIGQHKAALERIRDEGCDGSVQDQDLSKLLASAVLEKADVAAKRERLLRRWRHIPAEEKERSFFEGPHLQLILEHVRKTGDATVHSTGPGLSQLMDSNPDGGLRLRLKPTRNPTRAFEIWRLVSLMLLSGANRILEVYYVGYGEQRRIEQLVQDIVKVPPAKVGRRKPRQPKSRP